MDGSSRRLAQLVRILDETSPRGETSMDDPADHLRQLRLQRIQRLTAQLGEHAGHDADDVDAVAMRLVLDDYSHVLAHVRTVAAESAKMLEGLAASVRADRRRVDERLQQQVKQRASTAPSDR